MKAQAQAQQKQIELQADAQKFKRSSRSKNGPIRPVLHLMPSRRHWTVKSSLRRPAFSRKPNSLIAQMRAASDQSIAEKKADAMEDQSESQQRRDARLSLNRGLTHE